MSRTLNKAELEQEKISASVDSITIADNGMIIRASISYRKRGEYAFANLEYLNEGYKQGRKNMLHSIKLSLEDMWNQYQQDRQNIPEPDFMSAITLISIIGDGEDD